MLVPLIAVFWNDLNPLTSGQIYYRESFSTSDLTKAKEDVVKANVSFASYLPSRSFIITYNNMGPGCIIWFINYKYFSSCYFNRWQNELSYIQFWFARLNF